MKIKEGDIFFIPSSNKFGLAKVIFCSKYFKDVILIKLYCDSYEEPKLRNTLNNDEYVLYYTGKDSARKGKWLNAGFEEVSDYERKLSKRIVGGDVWEEDNHIGPASENELSSIKKMQTYGYRLIEEAVTKLK